MLAVVAFAVYAPVLGAPYLFDDLVVIPENLHLRNGDYFRHEPWWERVLLPKQTALSGRPVVIASVLLNYAVDGIRPVGYRLVNVGLHVVNACLLAAIVRRTLRHPRLAARYGPRAGALAWAAALLWLVHPLQTESVTYTIQRTEVIMSMWYLATLYASIRAWDGPRSGAWGAAAVACCALGMGSKEVMVTAPVAVALYDRVFLADSWAEGLRRRWPLWLGLVSCWIVLAWLMWLGPRTASVGTHLKMSVPDYVREQLAAVFTYLRLSFVPIGLCVDYGTGPYPVMRPWEVLAGLAVVPLVVGATLYALWRRPAVGYLGAWVLLILAPTSTVVPIVTEPVAERRMYLPLAAIIVGCVLAAYGAAERWAARRQRGAAMGELPRVSVRAIVLSAVALTVPLALVTTGRNRTFLSAEAAWRDVVDKRPENVRGWQGLGETLFGMGRGAEAEASYRRGLALHDDYQALHGDLASAIALQGVELLDTAQRLAAQGNQQEAARLEAEGRRRLEESLVEYEIELERHPENQLAYASAATVLSRLGRDAEAEQKHLAMLRVRQDFLEGRLNYAQFLYVRGRVAEAREQLEYVLARDPGHASALNQLATVLVQQGDFAGAAERYRTAMQQDPASPVPVDNLARIFLMQGKPDEALTLTEQATALAVRSPPATVADLSLAAKTFETRGQALLALNRPQEAEQAFAQSLQWDPQYLDGARALGLMRADRADWAGAAALLERVVAARPGDAQAREILNVCRQRALVGGGLP